MLFSPFFTSYFERRRTLSVEVDCCDCPEVLGTNRYGEILFGYDYFNTLRTGDADLRFYVTTVQDG